MRRPRGSRGASSASRRRDALDGGFRRSALGHSLGNGAPASSRCALRGLEPPADKRDRSRPGCLGYSQYTWRNQRRRRLWKLVHAGGATQVTDVLPDEFGTRAFSCIAPDGYSWTFLEGTAA